jgi:hypothetical protein
VPDDKKPDGFTDLLTKLVRVPKEEIDEQELEYQDSRLEAEPAKARGIVPIKPGRSPSH